MVFVGAPSATVLVLSCSHAVPFGPFGRSFVHGCSSFVAVHIRARFFHRFGFHVYLSPYHMDNRAALVYVWFVLFVRAVRAVPSKYKPVVKSPIFEPVQSFTRARVVLVRAYSVTGSTIVISSVLRPVLKSIKLQTAVFTTL